MTTIRDIAQRAKVSAATVSRILNNDPSLSVTDDTRKRVLEIVSELNYKPTKKKGARTESLMETRNIGLILVSSEEDERNDPYFMSVRLGVERASEQLGINIASVFTIGKSSLSSAALSVLDGLIVIGTIDSQEIKEIYFENDNIVFVDYVPSGNFDSVISDLENATVDVIEHLYHLGHREFAYLGGRTVIKGIDNQGLEEIEDTRKLVFEREMKARGLYKQENVLVGEWGPNGGYTMLKELMEKDKLPTALVVASDPMALGAFRALHEEGIRVPQDISVFSFDDIETAAYLSPALSTVKIHSFEMGKTAVKLVDDRIKGREIPLKVVVPAQLVLRESVSVPKIQA
jgi:LacI family transcriptional regulator